MESLHQHVRTIEWLAYALHKKLTGFNLYEAYTLSKEELVLLFNLGECFFSIKTIISNGNCYLLFDDKEIKRVSNAQPVFEPLFEERVKSIYIHQGERSFEMQFNAGYLVFKMYNGLANIIRYTDEKEPVEMFRMSIKNDWKLSLSSLRKNKSEYNEMTVDVEYFIVKNDFDYSFQLSTNANDEVVFKSTDLLQALTQHSRLCLSIQGFAEAKRSVMQCLKGQYARKTTLLNKIKASINTIDNEIPLEEIGHLIMANIHDIKQGETKVTLADFYRGGKIDVKMKKDLSPQDNAAYYYRKAQNRKKEKELLHQRFQSTKELIHSIGEQIAQVEQAYDMKSLKPFLSEGKKEKKQELPFKVFRCDDFEIWVGKNAANNDLLTMKHAHKNDLWLHAKGVSGSHVVIKHKTGKNFTNKAIEYAAAIAAYYSKLSGSSLVPVAYALKKYVRKPKGMEPGQVVMDREEVVMVVPGIGNETGQ